MSRVTRFSDYKYRKLRNMIKTSKVARTVKNLLLCAVHDYQYNRITPGRGAFVDGRSRCLIGAGLHDRGIRRDFGNGYSEGAWSTAATEEFGVTEHQVNSIIEGFDYGYVFNKSNISALARRIAKHVIPEETM